jgi:hypothetical protein
VTETRETVSRASVPLVRRALLALTVITILATAFELATVAHWQQFEQLIPWIALGVLVVATALSLLPGRWARIGARALALVVFGAAAYGVIDHILANYDSGPLDYRFADTWATMPSAQRWWYAFTKTVGPSPTLAPGVLGLAATLLLLASLIDTRPRRVI